MFDPTRIKRRVLTIAVAIGVIGAAGPAAVAASVTVAAAGDIAKPNAPGTAQTQTAGLITNINPAKVLVLGDEQYDHGEYAQFLRSYDPTWGAFNSISAPVPGNHEYETPNAAGYFQYFSAVLGPYGATATDATKGYYSFNLGDWHIVALNSNCSIVNCTAERSWLQQDLTADTHVCELAFYHHPTKRFPTTLAAQGVELSLTGHKHKYERWDHVFGLNLRELIVGTGGKSLGNVDPAADAGVKAYGVASITLNVASYSWSFIDVAGAVRDSGSDTCHA
jgi:calcineurin-like phosphoesterase family protein